MTHPLTHLIIVCCHAIYKGGPTKGRSEDEWEIEPFQKGETPTFTAHIKAGLCLAAEDPASLLVFSGGPTKQPRTSLSEGESYLNLALANNLYTTPFLSTSRITTELYATDSYQNLLFSLLKFRVTTGHYPSRVTVVTHEFKRARFEELHFPAVGLSADQMRVVGINPPEEVTPLRVLVEGEERRGLGLWRRDRYGVGAVLGRKRIERGWKGGIEGVPVLEGIQGDEVVEALVRWDGGETGNEWFDRMGELPWYIAHGGSSS
ncbi:DUF218 domain protein [Aspergillus saccharolyticus JOP 1030-1]|uniref:DUF218 domain-containing protein n=1 Tax=Aspergillus saccharolyticus JOP 1030-1 TaxID=1450539 RepID=A0A319AAG1_9EURO|nr:hypothetical protein BP01DRAFT_406157 [Aspergillus saccharolyticus JOP 1030-1]PYH48618.1 hypothetical protein BP01DRAFT_406157 [Aspergillus saccharolyticus JOP 1030-1]